MNDEKPTDRTPWTAQPAASSADKEPAAAPAPDLSRSFSARPPAAAPDLSRSFSARPPAAAPDSDAGVWVRPPTGPATGAVALLAKTLVSPGEAFEEVSRRRRSPLLPLLLLIALSLVASIALISRSDFGVSMEEQMKSNPRMAQMDDAQRARAIAVGTTIGKFFALLAPVFVPLGIVLVSAVLWVCLLIGGKGPRFPDVFRVVCWGQGPGMLGSLAFIAVALFSGGAVDLNNPVASNLGALLDPATAAKPLVALLKSVDVFAIWALVLYAIGLAKAARSALAGKLALVFGLYAAVVVVKVGAAAIF